MGSGRGDRNQLALWVGKEDMRKALQWGPVVVTGISGVLGVVAQLGGVASMGSGRGDRNQWQTQ